MVKWIECVDHSPGQGFAPTYQPMTTQDNATPVEDFHQSASHQICQVESHSLSGPTERYGIRGKRLNLTAEERKEREKVLRSGRWKRFKDKLQKDPIRYPAFLNKAKESNRKYSYLSKAESIQDPSEKELFLKEERAKRATKTRKRYSERKQLTGFGSKRLEDYNSHLQQMKKGTGTVEDILYVQDKRMKSRQSKERVKKDKSASSNDMQKRRLSKCKRYELDSKECDEGHK